LRNDNEEVKTVTEAVKRKEEIDKVIPKPENKKKPMAILDYVDKVKAGDYKTLEMINLYQPPKKPEPTYSNLMKEIGRPDVSAAFDKITKKKITKIPKLRSDNEVLMEYYKTGSPGDRARHIRHEKESKKLDKRLDIEMGNKPIEEVKKVEVPEITVPRFIVNPNFPPQEDVRVVIKRLADNKLQQQRKAFRDRYGSEGIASLKEPS